MNRFWLSEIERVGNALIGARLLECRSLIGSKREIVTGALALKLEGCFQRLVDDAGLSEAQVDVMLGCLSEDLSAQLERLAELN